MGLVPRGRDAVDRIINHERRIQFQEIRREDTGTDGRRTSCHTFIVGGQITVGLYIPPFIVMSDPGQDPPETWTWDDSATLLRAGTVTIEWKLRPWGGSESTVSAPQTMAYRDALRPSITAITGAPADLSVGIRFRVDPA